MRRLLSLLTPVCVLLTACNARHSDPPYVGSWTQVTRVNNEYVIYIPCALDLRKMKVTDSAIHEVLPMEVNDSHIVSTTTHGNGYRLKGKESVYTFKWEDEKKVRQNGPYSIRLLHRKKKWCLSTVPTKTILKKCISRKVIVPAAEMPDSSYFISCLSTSSFRCLETGTWLPSSIEMAPPSVFIQAVILRLLIRCD